MPSHLSSFPSKFFVFAVVCLGMSCGPFKTHAQDHGSAVVIPHVPIIFEPNVGQADPKVHFIARSVNMDLRLRSAGFDLSFQGVDGRRAQASFVFVAPFPNVSTVGETPDSAQTNYLIGSDPSRWLTHIPSFGRVRYSTLYPHIDLVFHGNGPQLEHDFVISPGGDVTAIRMRMVSPGQLARNPDGSIKISTPDGDLFLTAPSIYQEYNGEKKFRHGRFLVKARNEIGFEVGKYDRTQPLIIDPVLVFSTFLAPDELFTSGVATDMTGNTYITGVSFSSSSPAASVNAFQKTCNSCNNSSSDIFVMKLDPTGSQLLYSTFLGGSSYDQPNAIAVDANGNAIVTGYTQSIDFPVKNSIPYGSASVGTYYGFVTSVAPDGASLNYSSLVGGAAQPFQSTSTFPTALGLDTSGNAYVAGVNHSPFPSVTPGALNAAGSAYPNLVFLTKFLTDGSLAYSALIGDTAIVQGGGCCFSGAMRVKVDSSGSAYIFGRSGALWPTTPGAYQTQIPAPSNEAVFLTKVSPDASQLVYSTFIGPDSLPHGLDIDASGDAFITGEVNYSFPLTPNAYQSTFSGTCCASYLAELDPTGSKLLYSTYFTGIGTIPAGTSFQDLSPAVALDRNGDIWLAGTTSDPGFPLVHPVQSTLSNSAPTGYVSEFDPTGTMLLFSTYFGSLSGGAQLIDLVIDPMGKEHIAGVTGTDLYISPGSFLQSVNTPAPNTRPVFGFAAVIDPSVGAPALCVGSANAGLFFGGVAAGSSRSQTVTITNCGTANSSLNISSIASSTALFTVPSGNNNCISPLTTGAACTFTVSFAPTTAGFFSANLTLTANSAIPQTVLPLSGQGTVPVIQLSTTIISFDPLFIGQTVSTRAVFIQNVGTAPLVIDPVHTTATPSPTFTWQNGCTQKVNPRQFCILPLTFTAPNSPGTVTGTLSIASNDPANPVITVTLSGSAVNVYPVPAITMLDHPSAAKGSSISLGVIGQGFFPTSTISVNGVAQTTTYSSANALYASVGASFFSSMGEVTVTVSNPTPGGGVSNSLPMTVYVSLPISPAALIYDSATQLLYAAIPANAAANPNTIIPIDPTTGIAGGPIPIGNDPRQLAISDDGIYLYVALVGDKAIRRINVQTSAIERTFAFPPNQTTVSDMHVVPGSSQSLVAAFDSVVALYADGGLVNSVPAPGQTLGLTSFAFVGPSTIYGLPFTSVQNHYFYVLTLNSQGLQFTPVTGTNFGPDPETGAEVVSDGIFLYASAGEVWNPATQSLAGTFPVSTYNKTSYPNMFNTAVDSSLGQLFVIGEQNYASSSSAAVLSAYSMQSLGLTDSLAFPQVLYPYIGHLVRWGTDGFAFIASGPNLTDQEVYILRSSIAATAAATQTSITLSSPGSLVGQLVTITTAVTAGGNPVTSGGVALIDNGTQIGTVGLDSSGQAVFTTSALTPGQHTISAIFGGNHGFLGSISSQVTEIVTGIPGSLLNPTSLSFSGQTAGTTSAPLRVLLSNPGSAVLLISGIAISGPNSSDFLITAATCPIAGGTLSTGSSCSIDVAFTPSSTGTRNANLTVTDDAAGSPNSVSLMGTTSGLSLSVTPGSSTSATLTAGQTATFSLEISPVNGFTGPVMLTCTGAPANSTCSTNPSTLMLANAPVSFTVSVSTMSHSEVGPFAAGRRFRSPSLPPIIGSLVSASILIISFVIFWSYRSGQKWYPTAVLCVALLLSTVIMSCSGGGAGPSGANPSGANPSSPTAPSSLGTPAGTYTLNVKAVSGNTAQSMPLTLNVQ